MLSARTARVAVTMVAAAAVAAGSAATEGTTGAPSRYCAVMSDSIGLYRGNAVTRMGVPIGSVDRLDVDNDAVRVSFTLEPGVTVPAGVTAVTRASTILADRSMELNGGDFGSGDLVTNQCIPLQRTATAKSISESTAALTGLLTQMTDAGGGDTMNRLLGALDDQLRGNGATMRDAFTNLAAVHDPTRSAASATQLLKDLAAVMAVSSTNWSEAESILGPLPTLLRDLARGVLTGAAQIFGPALGQLSQVLLDLATTYHDLLWTTLDTATAAIRLLAEHTGVLVANAGTLPNILDGVRSFWSRLRHRTIPVTAPRVDAGATEDGRVCSRIAPTGPDHCGFFYGIPDGVTSVDVLQLVLKGGAGQP